MSQPYIGEIRMFAGNFAPAGWMLCQGQLLPISEYDTLFNLIGTTYGGDGQSTFSLPDLQGRVPVHMGTGSDGTSRTLAETGGVESVTLTTQQIPAHTHPFVVSQNTATVTQAPGNVVAEPTAAKLFTQEQTFTNMSPSAIGSAGGSQPHTNLQPYVVVNFIISLFGIFPSQT